MSLVVAVPFGIASATVYGASIVVQHRAAARHADAGQASAAGLLRLIKDPIFLLAIAGDGIGFLLQIIALSTGQVVYVQPLVVLMLPISLGVSSVLGWHRARPGDLLGCVAVLGGLAGFLALIGHPAPGGVPRPRTLGLAIVVVLVAGAVLAVSVAGRARVMRGAMYGVVAGMYFGLLAVMVDAASDRAGNGGAAALFTSPRGLIPLAGILVLGAGGIVLTQMSFQVGALGATLPANLAADPLTGVVFGVVLLRERIPLSAPHLLAYLLCLAAVVAGAIRLAAPATADVESPPETTRSADPSPPSRPEQAL